ncbi:hypothetical protein LOTGIDRAFT_167916 [Lottia gigantea]|uniref:Uncharacterized protein n=1 Tax=Lottia gigantea TaxID=225164 RepID=V3ZWN6_LOTGI|nr:hypothetical protein LOTGIDRAFT_167916 [Lottia gigantea]ESO85336.1 hypothetical protein LOTGIDRAFT_167916 [Lottia gigantea]
MRGNGVVTGVAETFAVDNVDGYIMDVGVGSIDDDVRTVCDDVGTVCDDVGTVCDDSGGLVDDSKELVEMSSKYDEMSLKISDDVDMPPGVVTYSNDVIITDVSLGVIEATDDSTNELGSITEELEISSSGISEKRRLKNNET